MSSLHAGSLIPEFPGTFVDSDGMPHSFATTLAEGPLLLGIYKSSCLASKAMFSQLERIHARYEGSGLQVLGVSQDSANVTRSFIRREVLTFPVLIEGEDYPVTRAFAIQATPTVYVIRRDGTIAYTTMGFLRDQVNDIAGAVAAELGVPPRPIVTSDDAEVPLFIPG